MIRVDPICRLLGMTGNACVSADILRRFRYASECKLDEKTHSKQRQDRSFHRSIAFYDGRGSAAIARAGKQATQEPFINRDSARNLFLSLCMMAFPFVFLDF